jgi:hypothetical protein
MDENGHDHPIHFTNRHLIFGRDKLYYDQIRRYYSFFFLKKFCHYLLHYKVKIVTIHKALTYLVNKSNPNGRRVK